MFFKLGDPALPGTLLTGADLSARLQLADMARAGRSGGETTRRLCRDKENSNSGKPKREAETGKP
jgi:hypothetical protein